MKASPSAFAKIFAIFSTIVGLSEGQRNCEASSNFEDRGCKYIYQGLNFAVTRDDAIEFCKSINAILGPRLSSTGNFKFFARRAEECSERLHSAYSYDAANDALALDGIEIDRGGFMWKNESRPSIEFPCIVAEYSDEKLVVMPESCDIELIYICVKDPCFNIDCDEGKTCVATAGTCGYQCAHVTTTTTTTTTRDSTTAKTTAESTTTPVSTTSAKPRTTTTTTAETKTLAYISPTMDAIRSAGGLESWKIALIVIALVVVAAVIIGTVIACRTSKRCQRYSHYYHELLHLRDHADHHEHEHNVNI